MFNLPVSFNNKAIQQSVSILISFEHYYVTVEYMSNTIKAFIKTYIEKIKFFIATANFENIRERIDVVSTLKVIKYFKKFL